MVEIERTRIRETGDPVFDVDADERDAMETWHDQTRFSRFGSGRRIRTIRRFRDDLKTVRASVSGYVPELGDSVVPLPEPPADTVDLVEALSRRISTRREHLGGKITIDRLGALLGLAIRRNRVERHPRVDCLFSKRPYPTAGGLAGCEIYVCPTSQSLKPRPYRYDANLHVLVDYRHRDIDFTAVEVGEGYSAPASAIIITAVLDRLTAKYGPRGYRFAMLEAGHVGQNLVLAAAALQLPSLVYGSYHDTELEAGLGIDGLNEVVLSVILVGQSVAASTGES